MVKRKNIRARGKVSLSKYFQEFKEGQRVAVMKEQSIASSFPERLQGCTGVIGGKKGKTYLVKIKTQNKEKEFLIEPIHLKKIESTK